MRVFEGDEHVITALSAVGIESTVFGDPSAYMEDCCLKIAMDYMNRKRNELRVKLEDPNYTPEEKISFAGEIAKIDKQIKELRSKF